MKEWILCLLACSLGGAFAGVLILLLKRWLKDKLSPLWHCYIWLLMMVLLLVPISIQWPDLPEKAVEAPIYSEAPAQTTQQATPSVKTESIVTETPTRNSTANIVIVPQSQQSAVENSAKPVVTEKNEETTVEKKSFSLTFPDWGWTVLGIIWLAGAMVFFGRQLWSYHDFSRRLHRNSDAPNPETTALLRQVEQELGIHRPVKLAVTTLPVSPMLVGITRPVLYLPETALEQRQLRLVFLHELTHYRWGDLLYKAAAMVLQGIHWFNPLCACMAEDIDFSCELCCDQRVRRYIGGERAKEYGALLLELLAASTVHNSFSATFSMDKSSLKRRLSLIMKPKNTSRLLAILLAVCIAFGGAACSSTIAPEQKENAVETAKLSTEDSNNKNEQLQVKLYPEDIYLEYGPADSTYASWSMQEDTVYVWQYSEQSARMGYYQWLIYDPQVGGASTYETQKINRGKLTLDVHADNNDGTVYLQQISYTVSISAPSDAPTLYYYRNGVEQEYKLIPVGFRLEADEEIESRLSPPDFAYPIAEGDSSKISALYGNTVGHAGVDIAAEAGTNILASAEGTVTYADYQDGNGYTVELDHGNGWSTLYAHCQELLVTAGQQVKQGEAIATVGSSGLATGNALHFELRLNGVTRDPAEYISEIPEGNPANLTAVAHVNQTMDQVMNCPVGTAGSSLQQVSAAVSVLELSLQSDGVDEALHSYVGALPPEEKSIFSQQWELIRSTAESLLNNENAAALLEDSGNGDVDLSKFSQNKLKNLNLSVQIALEEAVLVQESSNLYFSSPLNTDVETVTAEISSANGVSVSVPTGTAVYATAPGTVSEVVTDYVPGDGLGIYVTVEHEDGYVSTYGHLSSVNVKEGDQVRSNVQIGTSGSTGNSAQEQLYFELKQGESYIDTTYLIENSAVSVADASLQYVQELVLSGGLTDTACTKCGEGTLVYQETQNSTWVLIGYRSCVSGASNHTDKVLQREVYDIYRCDKCGNEVTSTAQEERIVHQK